MDRGGSRVVDGAVRPGPDGGPAAGTAGHYPWIRSDGLDYFRRRLELAPRDAKCALRLVVDHARTRVQQEQAVAALRFKCGVRWSLLDAVAAGYPDLEPSV
jgi:coenzyme PQQ biosynthesis protein C